MLQGVGKSGSPTPKDIISSRPIIKSKNLRIPDGGVSNIFLENLSFLVFIML